MTKAAKEKLSYAERFAQTSRHLTLTLTIGMSLGMAAITAVVLSDQNNQISYWFWIALSLIAGAVFGFIECWLLHRLLWWLLPTELNAEKVRFSLISIALLALILSWINWSDVPTNAQIDAVHNDPRFTAAIAALNEKQTNPELLVAAMKNGHAHIDRYTLFAILTAFKFIVLLFIFGTFYAIYIILTRFFGRKHREVETPSN